MTPASLPLVDPERYARLELLGRGGTAEVWRVEDRLLHRTVAMKILDAERLGTPAARQRFVSEAQATAQLQHPGIVPVHEIGRLEDGRAYFTMREVAGRTLGSMIQAAHDEGADTVALRRLVDAFRRVCETVAYAHARGVVHRDLKPDNVMVGPHGEVLVLDWGLAKVRGATIGAEPVVTERTLGSSGATRSGAVAGTPAYMAPEQARGEVDRADARADVYALGATLYEILAGRPPYDGSEPNAIVRAVVDGPPPPVQTPHADLAAACAHAMAREPGARPADAAALSVAAQSWLDGTRRRERAEELVAMASAEAATLGRVQEEIDLAAAAAAAIRLRTPSWVSEESKAELWAAEDRVAALSCAADEKRLDARQALARALHEFPGHAPAHAALVDEFRGDQARAESRHDASAAAMAERLVRMHLDALPPEHPIQGPTRRWLDGTGALTLLTDPPGAVVRLYRYVAHARRLVPSFQRVLGTTPLHAVPLPMGSYLLAIEHPDRAQVRYPVVIGRQEHWDGALPGTDVPAPVPLPPREALGPDDRYVPPGPFLAGGDADATDPVPSTRAWCHGLVVRRFPVTNAEYITFLDDLVARGDDASASAFEPRFTKPIYARDGDGRHHLQPDDEGDRWLPRWPVVMVDLPGAQAYASWLASRTGLPWRLPGDLEWEKAARGVDGRHFPWGDAFDPSLCSMRESHPGRPIPTVVDLFPRDEGPYGLRGCAGNVRDWCGDTFVREIAPLRSGHVIAPSGPVGERAVHRGGSWNATRRSCRLASRIGDLPSVRMAHLGLRVMRRWPG